MTSPRSTPPPLALTSGPWRERAACLRHPTLPASTWDDALVGQRETDNMRANRVEQALAVCHNTCPVRRQCLDDVNLDYDEGIRGGEDLRLLKERRRRTRLAATA